MRLRVVTYNIHHGVGTDGRLDLGRAADVLAATGATVVGLQEVDRTLSDRSGWADQAAWLGERLGMEVVHGATLDRGPPPGGVPGAPHRRYGNALLTTHPLRSWQALRLPGGERRREPRGVVDAVLDVDGTPVRCAVTHLQNRSRRERHEQAAHLVDLLGRPHGAPDGAAGREPSATVLVGDLNAGPDSPEVRLLTATFVDAWAAVGAGDGFTFDARTPFVRIDHVLTAGGARPLSASVVDTQASDHRPLVVDLDLRPAPSPG